MHDDGDARLRRANGPHRLFLIAPTARHRIRLIVPELLLFTTIFRICQISVHGVCIGRRDILLAVQMVLVLVILRREAEHLLRDNAIIEQV